MQIIVYKDYRSSNNKTPNDNATKPSTIPAPATVTLVTASRPYNTNHNPPIICHNLRPAMKHLLFHRAIHFGYSLRTFLLHRDLASRLDLLNEIALRNPFYFGHCHP